jgi:hypothetical protein
MVGMPTRRGKYLWEVGKISCGGHMNKSGRTACSRFMTQGQSTHIRPGVSEQRGSKVTDADRIPNCSWGQIII